MQIKPIKKEFKNLGAEDLIKQKNKISNFLFKNPKLERRFQGLATIYALHDLAKVKEDGDEFVETVIRELFFE